MTRPHVALGLRVAAYVALAAVALATFATKFDATEVESLFVFLAGMLVIECVGWLIPAAIARRLTLDDSLRAITRAAVLGALAIVATVAVAFMLRAQDIGEQAVEALYAPQATFNAAPRPVGVYGWTTPKLPHESDQEVLARHFDSVLELVHELAKER